MIPVCRQGHAKVSGNVYVDSRGVRVCRTCKLAQANAYNRRRKWGQVTEMSKYQGKKPLRLLTRDKDGEYIAGQHAFGKHMRCLGCGTSRREHLLDGLDCPTPVSRRQKDSE